MTQKSWPWSTVAGLGDGAAELGEDDSRLMLATYFGIQDPASEGVSKGVLNELEVTGAASPLAVNTGSAICYGLYYNDASVNLTVTTPAVGTTGGRVVLQTNWAGTGGAGLEARTRLAVISSADGVAAIPALTQTAGVTWEISLATFTITTGGVITLSDDRTFRHSPMMVDTAEIFDDAIDDSKLGDRVAQFYRRQGGNASDWSTTGTTTYTPGAVRKQAGSIGVTLSAAPAGVANVTFPVAFSNVPLITGLSHALYSRELDVSFSNVTANGFTINIDVIDGTSVSTTVEVNWEATGPE